MTPKASKWRNQTGPHDFWPPMPLFYFHLCNGQGFVEDEEGKDYPDLAAARNGAIEGLRDALAGDICRGEIHLAAFIEIEDEQHEHVGTIHFEDAIRATTESVRKPR